MRIPDLDKILSAMLQTYDGISDLNFSVGHPMQVEDFGELKPVFVDPPIEALTPYQTEQIALTLMQGNRRLIYEEQPVHIVTLEDPIEFVHPTKRATFNQRELGHDFNNYPNGLRAALRQAPKVILVGEMRDRATVEVALMAAETGHLVLSTLHTVDAGQSINRILGLFSLGEEQQLRIRLADTLRYIVSQRLAPKEGGGRQLLTEIMGNNLRTRETIAIGEGEHRSFYEIIEASEPFGWMTFDQSILNAYESELITEETARLFASRKGRIGRGIDMIQKVRGVDSDLDSGLRLDLPANAFR